MTANSDYGVSIVESFVPPANMLPGQEVNKDVYAVNTGSIDAFVKETVSGKLNYTYEGRATTFDTTKADMYVELSDTKVTAIDGATTNEAGGYLAWTNGAGVDVGAVNSARQQEDPAVTGRWHPTVTGDYIFRRSITGDDANPYTYAGYHYEADATDPENVEGKYYKIWIANDDWRAKFDDATPDSVEYDISVDYADIVAGGTDIALVADGEGEFTGTPTIKYIVEVPITDVTPTLTYHAASGDDAAYLEAYYAVSLADVSADLATAQAALAAAQDALIDDSRIVADAEVEYENAKGAYNTAKSRYDQTKADYDFATALATATNALYDAADTRMTVELGKQDAKAAQDAAQDEVNQEATDLANDYATLLALKADTAAISYKSLVQDTGVETQVNAMKTTLPNAKSNMDALKTKWDEVKAAAAAVDAALTILQDTDVTADQADAAYASLNTNLNTLRTALNDYDRLYANLKTAAASEPQLTGLLVDTATTAISTLKTSADNMRSEVDAAGGLAEDVTAFRTAWDAYAAYATSDDATADQAWKDAVDAYNTAVSTAKGIYDAAIAVTQPVLNAYPDMVDGHLEDNSVALIASYAAAGSNATTGQIATTPSYPVYTNYTGTPTGTAGDASDPLTVVSLADKDAGTESTFMSLVSDSTTKSLEDLENLITSGETDNVYDAYDVAKTAYETAVNNRTAHQNAVTQANADIAAANASIAAAMTDDPSAIKFKITLAKPLNWTSELADNASGEEAAFYFNEVLAAGDTSDKLIDSVTLDPSTTVNNYKSLTFDLNVDLDSAQVVYDNDQKTILPTAANDNDAFTMTAAVDSTDNKTVQWS